MCEYCGDPTVAADLPTPDIPKLRKLYEWACEQDALRKKSFRAGDYDLTEWAQGQWAQKIVGVEGVCGTAYCIAGKAAAEAGATWTEQQLSGEHGGSTCTLPNGRVMTVRIFAQQDLGLSHSEASRLFHGTNDIGTIHHVLRDIWERAGEKFDLTLPEHLTDSD